MVRMYGELRTSRRVTCHARFLGVAATVLRGEVVDVSTTGLCLSLDSSLERGRELFLEFDLPGGRVDAVGEVRWVVEKAGRVELGIRFVRISAESLAAINATLAPRHGGGWASQFALR
jgi:hypothetical protein